MTSPKLPAHPDNIVRYYGSTAVLRPPVISVIIKMLEYGGYPAGPKPGPGQGLRSTVPGCVGPSDCGARTRSD
eukprot:460153-Hanusia_phi.AAC.1